MPSSTISVRQCEKTRCKEPRAILLVDGKRKRARQCMGHLVPALRRYLPATQAKEAPQASNCGARRRKDGRPCQKGAGWGTDHPGYGACKLHGGNMKNHQIAAARQQAVQNALVMGMPIDVSPTDAILQCIRITAGEVVYSSQEIARLKPNEAVVQYREEGVKEGEYGGPFHKETTDARMHIWIKTRQEAMDRLARYSKMAHDMGIAERKIELAEKLGGLVGRMMRGLLDDLGLTPEQEKRAPEIVRRHLTVLEGEAQEMEQGS